MTERSQKAAHRALGIWCQRCRDYADVVAIYQHGASTGHPLGSHDQVPLCARHGRLALENDRPRPRLVEHEVAVARAVKAERARVRGGLQPRLRLRAVSVTGGEAHA